MRLLTLRPKLQKGPARIVRVFVNIFTSIRRRPTAMFLLLFQTLFLNVIVPGHTRGIITLGGASALTGLSDLGCASCCQTHNAGDSKHGPTSKDRENCAICSLAAHYTPPPVIDVRLTEFGLVALMQLPPPQVVERCDFLPTYYACGPPQAA